MRESNKKIINRAVSFIYACLFLFAGFVAGGVFMMHQLKGDCIERGYIDIGEKFYCSRQLMNSTLKENEANKGIKED